MAPGSIFHYINLPSTSYFCRCLFCNLYFPIYTTKIPKIFTSLSLLDLTFASDREGIDNPFIALVARFLIVCAGTRDLCVASYWVDTLVLKNWGKYLCYFAASSSPLRGKPPQAQDVALSYCALRVAQAWGIPAIGFAICLFDPIRVSLFQTNGDAQNEHAHLNISHQLG